MGVKVHIPTIEDRIKKLVKFDKTVFEVAARLKLLLFSNWEKGIGADDLRMKNLTSAYKKIKQESGRNGTRNLIYSGNMLQSLDPKKKQDFVYVLKFNSGTERKKAQGNVEHAPNMMLPISDRIDRKLQQLAYKLFTGK